MFILVDVAFAGNDCNMAAMRVTIAAAVPLSANRLDNSFFKTDNSICPLSNVFCNSVKVIGPKSGGAPFAGLRAIAVNVRNTCDGK